jgi:hypothetical protein
VQQSGHWSTTPARGHVGTNLERADDVDRWHLAVELPAVRELQLCQLLNEKIGIAIHRAHTDSSALALAATTQSPKPERIDGSGSLAVVSRRARTRGPRM